MPFAKVTIKPGINVEFTPTLNEGGWSASNLIRFKAGLPQKLGGWQRLSSTPIVGTCRGMHAWTDLAGNAYLGLGTEQRLEVWSGGQFIDITPVRATHNVAVAFTTTISTPTVKITDAGHGATAGDWVQVLTAVAVGGLIIKGFYQIASVVDANNYNITAASNATASVAAAGAVPSFTSTGASPNVVVTFAAHGQAINSLFDIPVSTTVSTITMFGSYVVTAVGGVNTFTIVPGPLAGGNATVSENGGNVRLIYLLSSGNASATLAAGYGVGIYGAGLYGVGSGLILAPLRQWYLDNFGQNLVGNYNGSTLYQWVPPASIYAGTLMATNPATPVTNAPLYMATSFVSNPQQMVVTLGAETVGTQDPLLVRWCDAGVITSWTATATNQAGSFRLSTGSKIVGGAVVANQNLIWTDIDLWAMQYTGLPFVWGFTKIGAECGLISGKAMGTIEQAVYWMGQSNFYTLAGGGVQVIPCPVWDAIFRNINTVQVEKIFCGTNSYFSEIVWYYPSVSGGTGEIDSYVKYNKAEQAWDYGTLGRTAWIDQSAFGSPIGTDLNKLLQQHEVAVDADGQPMMESITSGYFDVGDGEMFIYIERFIPDFIMTGSAPQLLVTFRFLDYPFDASNANQTITAGPYTITNQSQMIIVRARSRQVAIRIDGVGIGTFWRFGALRHNGHPDGRR